MYTQKLGIIGGFGAYATLNFYKRFLEIFAAETEREYPHIIMDNNFVMPSRTKALLYGSAYDIIVEQITDSMKLMLNENVDKIVLVCGTAHYFLEDVYSLLPQARNKVIDIIDVLGENMNQLNQNTALVIAAEGILKKDFYTKKLCKYNISCTTPSPTLYSEIRHFIESVKQNSLNSEIGLQFINFLKKYGNKNVILGCTEFPVLVNYINNMDMEINQKKEWEKYFFLDPLEMTLLKLKQTMK